MKTKFTIFLLTTSLSTVSFAKDLYVFADLTQNKTKASDSQYLDNLSDSGYNLGIGYAFSNMFSAEITYRDIFSASKEINNILHFYSSFSSEVSAIQISAIARHDLSEKLGVYGRLGLSEVKNEYSYSQYIPMTQSRETDAGSEKYTTEVIGVGADYALNNQWGLRMEYSIYSKIEGATMSSFGGGIYFNF